MSPGTNDFELLHTQKGRLANFLAHTDNGQNWLLPFSDGIPIMKP